MPGSPCAAEITFPTTRHASERRSGTHSATRAKMPVHASTFATNTIAEPILTASAGLPNTVSVK